MHVVTVRLGLAMSKTLFLSHMSPEVGKPIRNPGNFHLSAPPLLGWSLHLHVPLLISPHQSRSQAMDVRGRRKRQMTMPAVS